MNKNETTEWWFIVYITLKILKTIKTLKQIEVTRL